MPERTHRYTAHIDWTGNRGRGTADYTAYGRDFVVRDGAKPEILGSTLPVWRGDGARFSPDDLLVAALSSCHMLWYLHLCAVNGVVVEAYSDDAEGTLELDADGGGRFREVVLRPRVRISAGSVDRATALHREAHEKCFIARSVNFPVRTEPRTAAVPADTVPTPTAK